MARKVLVIGLDCASPELLFDEFINDLPNIKMMMENGIYGSMRSSDPPITIPAWMVMCTGKDPGKLGLYGFRHRKENSYNDIWIASSYSIKERTIWEILSDAEKKSCIIGLTPTYPPKPLNGWLITGFITPDATKDFTYPEELKSEVEKLVGEYIFDVVFRTDEKERLLREIYEMTEKRFKVIKYMLKNKDWDFFMFVEIGFDRLHHAFWKFYDKEHHLYTPNNKFESVIRDYYRYVDNEIGEILTMIDDDTVVIIVSDHGAKRMKGCVCINELLIREGYLTLKERPKEVISLSKAEVDWSRTKAWGWGGYYARVFLNMKGREENGVIEQEEYEKMRDELKELLENLRDPEGNEMDTKVFRPEELYPIRNGDPPDLMVYFDDLYWRSAGTIGHGNIYLSENDTGPDDAVHSQHGVFIKYDLNKRVHKRMDVDILDIAPTILKEMGLNVPEDMQGRVIE